MTGDEDAKSGIFEDGSIDGTGAEIDTLDFNDGATCGVIRARDGNDKRGAFENGSNDEAGATISLGVTTDDGEMADGSEGGRARVCPRQRQCWC